MRAGGLVTTGSNNYYMIEKGYANYPLTDNGIKALNEIAQISIGHSTLYTIVTLLCSCVRAL